MPKPFYVKIDVPEELAEASYEAIKIAKETGKIKRGTNETTKAVERASAKLVYVAQDVEPPEIVAHIPILCEERKVKYVFVPSKSRLGSSIGLGLGAAAACIIESGDAKNLVEEIISKLENLKKGG